MQLQIEKIYTGGNPSLLLRAEPDAFIDAGHGGKVGDGRGCGRAFWAIGNAAWRSRGNSLPVIVFVAVVSHCSYKSKRAMPSKHESLLLGAGPQAVIDADRAGGVGVGDVVAHGGRVAGGGDWGLGGGGRVGGGDSRSALTGFVGVGDARGLVVGLPRAGTAAPGSSVRRNDAVVCAGMTKGGSRFSSFLRYYWAVTIWRAQRRSCGALRLGVHREFKSRLGNQAARQYSIAGMCALRAKRPEFSWPLSFKSQLTSARSHSSYSLGNLPREPSRAKFGASG